MEFKKYQRKPTFVDMAKLTYKEAREILKQGKFEGKEVSISKEDKDKILSGKDNEISGYLATDGESYWFVNFDYAQKNYFLE